MVAWYETKEWKRIRRACLTRDGNRCVRCGTHPPRGKELQAHHIRPRREGGGDYLGNLVTLCNTCHDFVECEGVESVAGIIGYEEGDDIPPPSWQSGVYGGWKTTRPEEMSPPQLIAWVKQLIGEHSTLYHRLWNCPYADPRWLEVPLPSRVAIGSIQPPCTRLPDDYMPER